MIVILNPSAGGGRAQSRWIEFIRETDSRLRNAKVYAFNNPGNYSESVYKSLQRGETEFVAAGGDGTLNFLLNLLIESADDEQFFNIKLGAVGLGSSNDFHKPLSHNNSLQYPNKINFERVTPRDICYLSYSDKNVRKKKYFLNNASLGLTAEGNKLFNLHGRLLKLLKSINTNTAIYYTALKDILRYKNLEVNISRNGNESFRCKLSNLGIIKNPHFSGNLKYDSRVDYTNGLFNIFLCEDMSRYEYLHLLRSLEKAQFSSIKKSTSWSEKEITITSGRLFTVEYDGETIETDSVSFGILKNRLKVCKC
ncbi:diacylglycerol/lipid kinase family protein [Bacteroidota bacterium]